MNYQCCLDEGKNMLACSRRYYLEMDSVMTATYEHLRNRLKPGQQGHVINEQQKWLKFRDRQFKLIDKQNDLVVREREMVSYHEKAKITKERVLILIDRI